MDDFVTITGQTARTCLALCQMVSLPQAQQKMVVAQAQFELEQRLAPAAPVAPPDNGDVPNRAERRRLAKVAKAEEPE